MNIESTRSMIDWTGSVHRQLAKALSSGLRQQTDEKTKALLAYLKQHETSLVTRVAGFKAKADPKALSTLLYDYGKHTPLEVEHLFGRSYGDLSYDDIIQDVFAIHNQIMDLYRYLLNQSAIPEQQQLFESLLSMEENETRQMAQQVNRDRDL